MSTFIELHSSSIGRCLVNADYIRKVEILHHGGHHSVLIYADDGTYERVEETYQQVVDKIREAEARTKEGKRKLPPNTPLKEREESALFSARACAEKPKRQPFVPPTVEEVAEYIRGMGYTFDAQAFWHFYNCKG